MHEPQSFVEQHAWLLLLFVSGVSLLIGLGDYALQQGGDTDMVKSMTGTTWADLQAGAPATASLLDLSARVLGAWLIGFSVLGVAISATAYRAGERWAWFAMWSFPVVMALVFVAFFTADRVGDATPPGLYSAPAMIVISSLGLLLPARRFFRVSQ